MNVPDLLIANPNNDPDLGGESLRDLSRFLYSGGTAYRADEVASKLECDKNLVLQKDRIGLILAVKNELNSRLVKGDSSKSFRSYISHLTIFFRFLETTSRSFQLCDLKNNYFDFAKHLQIKSLTPNSGYKPVSAYSIGASLSTLFGSILEIPEATRLISRTGLKFPYRSKKVLSKDGEKQNLEATFKMGSYLVDLIQGLTKTKIYGKLPIHVAIRNGVKSDIYLDGLKTAEWESQPTSEWSTYQRHRSKKTLSLKNGSTTISGKGSYKRWLFVNLRIQAEFLVFIAQTGMNVTQAKELQRDDIKYKSHSEGWTVRGYKNRKRGEVTFDIYSSYKPYFEEYRSFVNHFFPNSKYLFPQFNKNGIGESTTRNGLAAFDYLKVLLQENEIAWTPPRLIRNSRVNWILRRSGDEKQTAEMAQHTVEVLRDRYAQPSLQRTIVETTKFWNKHDPIRKGDLKASVMGSFCDGKPEALDIKPDSVAPPNCISPSGCLWCTHHRDIDSQDYVWSLFSLRHLKSIEATYNNSRNSGPSDLVIDRLAEKINWFRNSNIKRSEWVSEASIRIAESYFHPNWARLIQVLQSI